jgi:hypothetical protein
MAWETAVPPLIKLSQPLQRRLWDSVLCHADAEGYVIVNFCDVHELDDEGGWAEDEGGGDIDWDEK